MTLTILFCQGEDEKISFLFKVYDLNGESATEVEHDILSWLLELGRKEGIGRGLKITRGKNR